jgi:hypothetical protein
MFLKNVKNRLVLTELPGRASDDDIRDLLPFNYVAVTVQQEV